MNNRSHGISLKDTDEISGIIQAEHAHDRHLIVEAEWEGLGMHDCLVLLG